MTGLLVPPHLRPGDQVAVIAPAGPVAGDLLESGLALLRSWNLVVAVGEHVRDTHPEHGYLAGTDEDRAADFTWAWSAPFDAVLAVRGGYGCQRMVDLVPWEKLKSLPPKVFAGSSDVTALHQRVAFEFGQATVFGPMVGSRAFSEDLAAREHLRYTLLDPNSVRVIGRGHDPIRGGVTEGVTVGGTVSLLASDIGTGIPQPGPGSIALLEDVNEDPYRLDGLLTSLLRSGWFDQVAGIALGSWQSCGPAEAVRAVLADRLGPLGVPVAWEVGFGHCDAQLTVPLGVPVRLDADAGTLTLL